MSSSKKFGSDNNSSNKGNSKMSSSKGFGSKGQKNTASNKTVKPISENRQMIRSDLIPILDKLLIAGLSPLPVVPAQDPEIYYTVKDGVREPKFKGKNPSFFSARDGGKPKTIYWDSYVTVRPSGEEISRWFSSPDVGIGVVSYGMFDLDLKYFGNDEELMLKTLEEWENLYPQLKQVRRDRTRSGGCRYFIFLNSDKGHKHFGFKHAERLAHIGEFTEFAVIAPTVDYTTEREGDFLFIDNLSDIGLFFTAGFDETDDDKPINGKMPFRPPSIESDYKIDLEKVCSLGTKKAIDACRSGQVEEGFRSDVLSAIAKDLYGWEFNFLAPIEVAVLTPAADIMIECGDGLGITERRLRTIVETIKGDCSPAILPHGEINAWKAIKRANEMVFKAKCPQEYKNQIGGTAQQKLTAKETEEAVINIIETNRNAEHWRVENELSQILAASAMGKEAYWIMVRQKRLEYAVSAEQENRIRGLKKPAADPYVFLPRTLAELTIKDASTNKVDPMVIAHPILVASSSRLQRTTTIHNGQFKTHGCLWGLIVSESGTGKSRGLSIVQDALNVIDEEGKDEYNKKVARFKAQNDILKERLKAISRIKKEDPCEYEQQLEEIYRDEPVEPHREYSVFDIGTIQGVVNALRGQTKAGSVWLRDEFIGIKNGANQFAGGKQTEFLDILLSMWDGKKTRVTRRNTADCFEVENPRLAMLGGLQLSAFEKFFTAEDNDRGLGARFLFVDPEVLDQKIDETQQRNPDEYNLLSGVLPDLFKKISNVYFGDLTVSDEAYFIFAPYYNRMVHESHYNRSAAVRSWLNKAASHCSRLMMTLHGLWCTYEPNRPRDVIQADIVNAAIHLMEYYRGCLVGLESNRSEARSLSEICDQILRYCEKNTASTMRDIYKDLHALKTLAKESDMSLSAYTSVLVDQLVEEGYLRAEKFGKTTRFFAVDQKEMIHNLETNNSKDSTVYKSTVEASTQNDTVDVSVQSKPGEPDLTPEEKEMINNFIGKTPTSPSNAPYGSVTITPDDIDFCTSEGENDGTESTNDLTNDLWSDHDF